MKKKKVTNHPEPDIYSKFNACSSTECTGLMTVPPQNEDELENYKNVYGFEVDIDKIK